MADAFDSRKHLPSLSTFAPQVAPGKRSPTVCQLDMEDWVAVQSLILKKGSSRVMDELRACGAMDILLFSLHNTLIC